MLRLRQKISGLSAFKVNVFTLMTGSIVAQALPIAISPLLTRLYSPEEFGSFALYMSITAILGVVITVRYELSIMLPKSNIEAANLVALSLSIALVLSLVLLIVIMVFEDFIIDFFGKEDLSTWLYFIPVSTLSTGAYQSLRYWNNRGEKYRQVAKSMIIQSSAKSSMNIVFGYSKIGFGGLVLGSILGTIVSSLYLFVKVIKQDLSEFRSISSTTIIKVAKTHKKFPQYDLPAAISYSLYSNMAIVFLNKFLTSAISGFYFFANRLLKVPMSFFQKALSDVLYQKFANMENIENIAAELNLISNKLARTLTIPFMSVVYCSYFYVDWVFGMNWQDLWKYMYMLSIPIYIGLILSPYGHVLKVINRQEVSFYLHLSRLIVIGCFLSSYLYVDYNFLWFIFILSLLESAVHIILGLSVDKLINNSASLRNLGIRLSMLVLFSIINYLILLK